MGVAFGVCLVLVGTACSDVDRGSESDRLAASLDSAFAGVRTIRPRLAGDTNFAPCGNPAEDLSCGGVVPVDRLSALAPGLRALDPGDPVATKLLARWELRLASAGGSGLDSAIARLLPVASTDAEAANDLAAAYLLLAARDGRRDHLLDALEWSAYSSSLAPSPAARFNEGLTLAVLGLRAAAAEIFGGLDDDWGREAVSQLPPSPRSPWLTKEVQDALVGRPPGEVPAPQRAAALRRFGERLATVAGDGVLLDTLDWLDGLDVEARREADAARESAARHLDAYRELQFDVAREHLAAATALDGSPMRGWMDIWRGALQFQLGEFDTAVELFVAARDGGTGPSRLLTASALRREGFVNSLLGNVGPARAILRSAAAQLADADPTERARIADDLAWSYRLGGDRIAAWQHRLEAVRWFDSAADPTVRRFVLNAVGSAAAESGRFGVARRLYALAAIEADAAGRPADRFGITVRRAALELEPGGDPARAAELVRSAEELLATYPSPVTRDLARGSLELVRGMTTADAVTRRAALGEAVRLARETDDAQHLPKALRARATLAIREGDPELAMDLLQEAVVELDRQRGAQADSSSQNSFRGVSRDVYSDLVALRIAARDSAAETHALVERWRSPALPATAAPAAGTLLLSYLVTEARSWVWVHRRGAIDVVELAAGSSALHGLVTDLSSELLAGRESSPAARDLFREILQPALALASDTERLVIIPDGPLAALPFTALDSGDGLVLERWPMSIAPSVAAWQLARSRSGDPGPRRLVAIAAQRQEESSLLVRLPYAEEEVTRIQTHYSESSAPASGDPATIASAIGQADVFHFAGHAVAANWSDDSYLLAPEPGSNGNRRLTATRIAALTLPRSPIAVLSACSTATQPSERATSIHGIAEAFLSAGARAVVASRWAVEDAGVVALMDEFHRELTSGSAPSEALRRAQLRARESGTSPRNWAAFDVYGAGHTAAPDGPPSPQPENHP